LMAGSARFSVSSGSRFLVKEGLSDMVSHR
jgi:hypothetical protein